MNAETFSPPNIAAVVVAYRPDEPILDKLLVTLSRQVRTIYLIDNGGCERVSGIGLPGVRHLCLGKNRGLGHALNAGFAAAKADNAEYVVTFDQDSAPPAGYVDTLYREFDKLRANNIRCAAVGPVFFDRRESLKTYFPFYREENGKIRKIDVVPSSLQPIETDVLITSGMLVQMSVWESSLPYDENMFIDLTDNEWCFRVRERGYRLFGCPSVEMGHAMSDAPPLRMFGAHFFRHSALRRYFYFRNTVLFCKKKYVSPAWKKRLLAGMVLRFLFILICEKRRLQQLSMILKGLWSGLRNRSGAYQS